MIISFSRIKSMFINLIPPMFRTDISHTRTPTIEFFDDHGVAIR